MAADDAVLDSGGDGVAGVAGHRAVPVGAFGGGDGPGTAHGPVERPGDLDAGAYHAASMVRSLPRGNAYDDMCHSTGRACKGTFTPAPLVVCATPKRSGISS